MDLQLPRDLAAHFSAETRLFELRARGPLAGLMVERWQAHEALSDIGHIELIGLSTDAHLPLAECIGERVDLLTTIADGSRCVRPRLVHDAEWLAGAPGAYAWAHAGEAERYARLALEATEAHHTTSLGRSTVRTLSAGTTFTLTESSLDMFTDVTGDANAHDRPFTLLSVSHYGINNLPSELAKRLEARLGATPEVCGERAEGELLTAARRTGYANRFAAIERDVPWRPRLADGTGARHNPRPTVDGPQTATVVGPDGAVTPNGADELYTDRLGRIKVRFHWQAGEHPDDRLSGWLRCAQGAAGPGGGLHMLPRIGTEVLVAFLGGDIDCPIVMGATYNGVGEAGIAPTPGGHAARAPADHATAYARAHDHRPAAQGNVAGGSAPAWHGAAAAIGAHRNAAALCGLKSREFGGPGHNQLVFDDSDAQQRVQVASTQYSSQLNLGHLIHQADNYRGSFRGTGFELRTDAYGAVRGERGLLLSTDAIGDAEPAGDFTAGAALLQQATALAQRYSRIAATHRTPRLAAHQGARKPNHSRLDDQASPLAALLRSVNGRVAGSQWAQALSDAAANNTAAGKHQVPHTADPILAIAARAGIGIVAGHHIHLHAEETITLAGGADHHWAAGEQLRLHAGQALGLLAGAQGSGEGLHLAAAEGDVALQAQHDQMKVQARDTLSLASANAEVAFAAKQTVHLANAHGAAITLEGGRITITCPGKLTVHAGQKAFAGPTHMSREFNRWPEAKFDDSYVVRNRISGEPIANMKVAVVRDDGAKMTLVTDAQGRLPKQQGVSVERVALRVLGAA